jgi:hypothetical protein
MPPKSKKKSYRCPKCQQYIKRQLQASHASSCEKSNGLPASPRPPPPQAAAPAPPPAAPPPTAPPPAAPPPAAPPPAAPRLPAAPPPPAPPPPASLVVFESLPYVFKHDFDYTETQKQEWKAISDMFSRTYMIEEDWYTQAYKTPTELSEDALKTVMLPKAFSESAPIYLKGTIIKEEPKSIQLELTEDVEPLVFGKVMNKGTVVVLHNVSILPKCSNCENQTDISGPPEDRKINFKCNNCINPANTPSLKYYSEASVKDTEQSLLHVMYLNNIDDIATLKKCNENSHHYYTLHFGKNEYDVFDDSNGGNGLKCLLILLSLFFKNNGVSEWSSKTSTDLTVSMLDIRKNPDNNYAHQIRVISTRQSDLGRTYKLPTFDEVMENSECRQELEDIMEDASLKSKFLTICARTVTITKVDPTQAQSLGDILRLRIEISKDLKECYLRKFNYEKLMVHQFHLQHDVTDSSNGYMRVLYNETTQLSCSNLFFHTFKKLS